MIMSILTWCMLVFSSLVFVILFLMRMYTRWSVKCCTSTTRLEGKTVLITGASAGIGKEAARDLASRGAKVILGCRNREKAQQVANDIIESTRNKNVFVQVLDTSLMSSVRAFAKKFLDTENRLDILVLNAGIIGAFDKQVTDEGMELTMATNHFGHFLLVNLLANLLRTTKPSRVVVTSSQANQSIKKINPKDLNFENESYGSFKSYALSKLCNLLMTRYLAVYFHGKRVTVNSLCPGLVNTEIFEKASASLWKLFFTKIAPIVGRTEVQGAQTIIHLAVSEDVKNVTGAFFIDCQERKMNPLTDDAGLIKKVWETSEDVVQLTPEERSERTKPLI